jgi:hypothetical protein
VSSHWCRTKFYSFCFLKILYNEHQNYASGCLYNGVSCNRVAQSENKMTKILILLLFIGWTTLSFGQGELQGTWILECYTVDNKEPLEITDRWKKEKMTFDKDGRYLKTYHKEELPEGARIHMTYNMLDKKVTKKYFDKDGYEIKVVRVKKKTDNGTYEKMDSGELRFFTEKRSYTKMYKIDARYLNIADTLDNRVIWSRYKKRS